ncbi:VRR-NUC domain-containing protein [Qingshengfaniella alkalisoli]|uniref:VRR-NUC domain-containing protein n=1 Tax=Qingshengfaniella alkalisoli TaxID=2599296 RepID=A0A5B8I858_9RHOB|nr:VRR-NUC domain-containing protein [Qingshengfaniella alkalisoli]QDY70115.1 VRR-NUC domain-containing protein [Qingshengfaniella alkalisoli]
MNARKGMPRIKESDLQANIVEWMRYALPIDAYVHHSPNEGKRGPKARADLVRMGCLKGFPDLLILWNRKAYFLEVKAPGGTLTLEQRHLLESLDGLGYRTAVVNSIEIAEAYLRGWGIPLRSRPMPVREAANNG